MPLKIDTTGPEWRSWLQRYKYEGGTIPIVMAIRADGEQLYGKSGSLPGEALPTFLLEILAGSGNIPNAVQLENIQTALAGLKSAREENDWKKVAKQLRAAKKIGEPGKLGSFSASAIELDQIVNEIIGDSKQRLQTLQQAAEVEGNESQSQLEQLAASFLDAKKELSQIAFLDKEIAKSLRSISRLPNIKKAIAMDKTGPSNSKNDLDVNALRVWTSESGGHTIEASFVSIEDGVVKLMKPNDEIIEVEIGKLSKQDRDLLKLIKK